MIKLIAVGNRLMRDDAVGIAVAEHLTEVLECKGVEVVIAETDFQYGFHLLKEHDFIIILDAVLMEENTGTVHIFNLKEEILSRESCGLQHDRNIFDLMQMYQKHWRGYIIGIEVEEVCFGIGLSRSVAEMFPVICSQVESVINRILEGELE